MTLIIGVNFGHDGSSCVLNDGDLVFHSQEERYSKVLKDGYPYYSFIKALNIYGAPAHMALNSYVNIQQDFFENTFFDVLVNKHSKNKVFKNTKPYTNWFLHQHHHLTHATQAFYNSGFKEAVCIVLDGAGSTVLDPVTNTYIRETHSIFTAEYPDKFACVHKKAYTKEENKTYPLFRNLSLTNNSQSLGQIFEKLSTFYGFGSHDAGKIMGAAAYGVLDCNVPKLFINGQINKDFVRGHQIDFSKADYLTDKSFGRMANVIKQYQQEIEEQAIEYIIQAIQLTGQKNVCISGGYAMNCVANYNYLKYLPTGINLYIEPMATDAGTSIGGAKYIWHNQTKDTTIRPLCSLYLGATQPIEIPKNVDYASVTYQDVAELLAAGHMVAIFQSKSESGHRALGNRSILFDPRVANGKDIVNTVKGREWFRPFAGTILEEDASQWFDMRGLKSSPFMVYAVNVLEEKKNSIPAITHVDGTCRIQTVNVVQNKHYYKLINAFKVKTQVPILFNTSFNLSGEPIVETLEDAINTLKRSKLEYLYLPELNAIVKIENVL